MQSSSFVEVESCQLFQAMPMATDNFQPRSIILKFPPGYYFKAHRAFLRLFSSVKKSKLKKC